MSGRSIHLFRRKAIYYWRKRLPAPLDMLTGRSHYCVSLHTSNHRHATQMARAISLAIDEIEERISRMAKKGKLPTKEQVLFAINSAVEKCLQPYVRRTLTHGYIFARDYNPEPEPFNIDNPEALAHSLRGGLTVSDFSFYSGYIDEALKSQKIELNPTSREYVAICKAAGQKIVKALDGIAAIETWKTFDGELDLLDHIFPDNHSTSSPAIKGVAGLNRQEIRQRAQTISELGQKYIKQVSSKSNEDTTVADDKFALRAFIELIGDEPISSITRGVAEKFREELKRIPRLNGKGIYTKLEMAEGRRIYTPMNLREAIKDADIYEAALGRKEKSLAHKKRTLSMEDLKKYSARLSLKTVNKHLSFFIRLFKSDLTPSSIRNASPFAGIMMSKAAVDKAKTKSTQPRIFRDDEIGILFSSPVWTGTNSMEPRWKIRDPKKPIRIFWDALFWVPLIALFSGMRREEICQLRPSDITKIHGVDVISVRGGPGMHVKNPGAIRDVPIHNVLIEAGILEYVGRMSRHPRLFQELKPNASGRFGDSFDTMFSPYLKRFVDFPGEVVFHSFRHTFITLLRKKYKVDNALVRDIVGHVRQGVQDQHYLSKSTLEELRECVNLIDASFWCDFTHLFQREKMQIVVPYENWVEEFRDHNIRRKYRNRL